MKRLKMNVNHLAFRDTSNTQEDMHYNKAIALGHV